MDAAPAPTLFRKEVVDAVSARLHGDVLASAAPRWPTALAVLPCLGLLLWLCLGSYTRTAGISGELVPRDGQISLTSLQAGQVWRLAVAEGTRVHAGDVLFELRSARASATQDASEQLSAALTQSRRRSLLRDQQLQLQRERQRAAVEASQSAARLAEMQQIAQQVQLQRRRVSLSEEAVARYGALQRSGFVALLQLQQQQADLLDQQQRLVELERNAAVLRHSLQAAQQDWRDRRWQSEREQEATRRELAALEQVALEDAIHRDWLVRAPRDGVVSSVVAVAGQTVPAGATLATLVTEPLVLEAQLFAPSRAAGFLRVGLPVRLRYHAYAFQKFGLQEGRISEVSATTMSVDPHHEPGYRVRVSLARQALQVDGQWLHLKPAARVDASVLLERRRLYEWLLEPLYALGRQS